MSEILEKLAELEKALQMELWDARPLNHPDKVAAVHRIIMLVARAVLTYSYSSRGIALSPAVQHSIRECFPLPPKRVLREVQDPATCGVWWRWNGRLEMMRNEPPCHSWAPCWSWPVDHTPERIKLWYDLMNNPDTEVPDEG
jgi:hypothetical protein